MFLFLRFGSVDNNRRTDYLQTQDIQQPRSLVVGHFFIKNHPFDQRSTTATVLFGPGNPGPAAFVHGALPVFQKDEVRG